VGSALTVRDGEARIAVTAGQVCWAAAMSAYEGGRLGPLCSAQAPDVAGQSTTEGDATDGVEAMMDGRCHGVGGGTPEGGRESASATTLSAPGVWAMSEVNSAM